VKLLRVLMLGPLVLLLSLFHRSNNKTSLPMHRLVPWFIIGFIVLMTLRSCNLIPDIALKPIMLATTGLTILAMAALGLGVDLGQMRHVGPQVTMAVCGSLILLGISSFILISLTL
jgi:uncharacterized membrane protein YadS